MRWGDRVALLLGVAGMLILDPGSPPAILVGICLLGWVVFSWATS